MIALSDLRLSHEQYLTICLWGGEDFIAKAVKDLRKYDYDYIRLINETNQIPSKLTVEEMALQSNIYSQIYRKLRGHAH